MTINKSLRVLAIIPLVWSTIGSLAIAQIGEKNPLPTYQQLSRLGLERVWWAQAVVNPSRDTVKVVSIDEEAIYIQASSGVTTAFDTETGHQKWAVRMGRFDPQNFPAISNEDETIIAVGSTMYGLNKGTGRVVWTLVFPREPSAGPAVDDTQVYIGTLDGMMRAFDLKKIRQYYAERRGPEWGTNAEVWRYRAGKEITSAPIVFAKTVCFASRDGSLYSVTAPDRKLNFQLETDKPIIVPMSRLDNMLFVASEDNTVMAVDMRKGQVIWDFTSGLPIRRPIWSIGNDLFILPERGGLYCLDPKTGDRRWSQPSISSFMAVMGDMLATVDVDGNLVMLSRANGTIIGSLPVRRFSVRMGNDRTDRLFLVSESGLVVCLRQIGHIDPVFHRYPDRLPLLPEFTPEEGSMPASEEGDMPATEEATDANAAGDAAAAEEK